MTEDPILAAFAARLARRPDHPLVTSRLHTATVADVDAVAVSVSRRLEASALEPGALVALASPNGPGFLAGLLALRRAACVALLMDWRTPEEEKGRVARQLGAAAELRVGCAWPGSALDVRLTLLDSAFARFDPEVAVLKLTSGSTGAPRGIVTPSAALVADDAQLAVSMGLEEGERILAAIPMSHSYGLSSVAMPALMRGSRLVVPDGDGPFDGVEAALAGNVTFLPTVPAYLQALLRTSQPPPLPPSLRLVITAGAPLPPEVATRFRAVYDRPVQVFYGASECGGICFDREGGAGERGTLGTPVDGVRITLEPAEKGGDVGVVTVSSPAVTACYHPEPDPRLGGGLFLTSDLGAFRYGELVLLGRCDDLINVRGKKVNPREVEEVLTALAGVDEAVVLGVPAPEGGGEVVRAVVACRAGGPGAEVVLSWCRSRLAPHKVPRGVMVVESLPRTARGKLDRVALRALAGHDR